MVSLSGQPRLQSRGTVMEDPWGLYRWPPACHKSHTHEARGFFFFFLFKKHHQQQRTPPHPVFSLSPRSQGIIEPYKSRPDDIKLLC